MNQLSDRSAPCILAVSMIPFFLNVYITARRAPKVTVNDPWGYGRRSSGPRAARRRDTTSRRSRASARRRPAFDLNHPEAGIPVGIGPAKDAPQAPVYDAATKEVK